MHGIDCKVGTKIPGKGLKIRRYFQGFLSKGTISRRKRRKDRQELLFDYLLAANCSLVSFGDAKSKRFYDKHQPSATQKHPTLLCPKPFSSGSIADMATARGNPFPKFQNVLGDPLSEERRTNPPAGRQ
jgi:hypothetical protein